MVRSVIITYSKGPLAGAEYEIESAAKAKKAHPDATISRFADTGEPFSEDAPRTEAAARKAAAEPPAEAKAE